MELNTGSHTELNERKFTGEMAVLDHTGDTKSIWDKNNADEVEAARIQFNHLKKKGFSAFYVKGKEGEQGKRMDDFDANAERIIFIPQMQGG